MSRLTKSNKIMLALSIASLVVCVLLTVVLNAAQAAPLPQRLDIVAQSGYGMLPNGKMAQLCTLTFSGQSETYVGNCDELGVDVYRQLSGENPGKCVTLTIDGRSYNTI